MTDRKMVFESEREAVDAFAQGCYPEPLWHVCFGGHHLWVYVSESLPKTLKSLTTSTQVTQKQMGALVNERLAEVLRERKQNLECGDGSPVDVCEAG